jgi:hypothetical protein
MIHRAFPLSNPELCLATMGSLKNSRHTDFFQSPKIFSY